MPTLLKPDAAFPRGALEQDPRGRATPLLRLEGILAKLESLRPAGCTDDRALAAWEAVALGGRGLVAASTAGAALAGAGWARARGRALHAIVHGPLTYEAKETLALWGASVERVASRAEAQALAQARAASGAQAMPPLDGPLAVEAAGRSLGVELLRELESSGLVPAALVAPAGCAASLLGALAELRLRWPALRGVALCAASESERLPELPTRGEALAILGAALALTPSAGPADSQSPGAVDPLAAANLELVSVSREAAQSARAQLARAHGLSASHAAAAAVEHARKIAAHAASLSGAPAAKRLVLALVTSTGEREFSLDPTLAPPAARCAPAST